jgi:ubiquinone/menaquinone biosynthesis C-methylase UbiE
VNYLSTECQPMEQLSDEQLKEFDVEYVDAHRWAPIQTCIDSDFGDGKFTFLDVGGGNGKFADRILAAYPSARGVVLDNSRLLLEANSSHPRKTTVLKSAEGLGELTERFDIVFFNWVLHHLVERGSYQASRRNIDRTLSAGVRVLTDRGRISVYENTYKGLFIDNAPGRIIFTLTSSRALAWVARRGGANTAGVGVCFQSNRSWHRTFASAGLTVTDATEPDAYVWPTGTTRRIFLHMRHVRVCHFWLRTTANLSGTIHDAGSPCAMAPVP